MGKIFWSCETVFEAGFNAFIVTSCSSLDRLMLIIYDYTHSQNLKDSKYTFLSPVWTDGDYTVKKSMAQKILQLHSLTITSF